MNEIIQLSQSISAIIVIIGAVTGIATFCTKKGQAWIKAHIFEPIQKPMNESIHNLKNEVNLKIDTLNQKQTEQDIARCKDYLTEFMADLENGVPKNEVQKQRFCEVYDLYSNPKKLNQNSYIHKKYEDIKERGLI